MPRVALVSIIALIWLHCLDVASDSVFRASENVSKGAISFENIVFCHVGKAGGNTFRTIFKGYCQADRKRIAEECQHIPESSLADRVTGYIHDDNFHGPVDEADAYMYNLRHPVDRMISWYNYEHPESCMKSLGRQTKRACATRHHIRRHPDAKANVFFNQCFPTQKELPFIDGNLTGSNIHLSDNCLLLAKEVINGEHRLKGFKHMFYNMHHYTKATIDKHPERSVIVIRTESLWQDLKDLDIRLGGNGNFGAIEGTRDSHGSEQYKKSNATFSVTDYGRLCCVIQKEMNIYRRLVELAVNLDEAETEATISRTASKCGFESWNELMNHCNNKRIP